MAQKRKEPRLYLKKRNDGGRPLWVIRDGSKMIATGFCENEFEQADAVLSAYCLAAEKVAGCYLPPQAKPREGWVYFASCDLPNFPIKIGWAIDVKPRMQSLQCSLPYKLRLLAAFRGTLDDERRLHIGYREFRLEGEWFARNVQLMEVIGRCAVKEAA